jgi:hypothetical protein
MLPSAYVLELRLEKRESRWVFNREVLQRFVVVPVLSRVPFPSANKVKGQHPRSRWTTIQMTTTTPRGGSMVSTMVIYRTLRAGGDTDCLSTKSVPHPARTPTKGWPNFPVGQPRSMSCVVPQAIILPRHRPLSTRSKRCWTMTCSPAYHRPLSPSILARISRLAVGPMTHSATRRWPLAKTRRPRCIEETRSLPFSGMDRYRGVVALAL